jgi:hypothetical protein
MRRRSSQARSAHFFLLCSVSLAVARVPSGDREKTAGDFRGGVGMFLPRRLRITATVVIFVAVIASNVNPTGDLGGFLRRRQE